MMGKRFTEDGDADIVDLPEALQRVTEAISTLDNQENEMDEPKTKKKLKKKVTAKKKAPTAKKKVVAAKAATKTNGDHVTLADLAKELKLEPTILRRRIRAMDGIKKEGEHRYAWTKGSPNLKKIRDNIRSAD